MRITKYGLMKTGAYLFAAWLLAVIQNLPAFPTVLGVKPMLVYAFAAAAAMLESEIFAAFFGAFCGLLCDFFSYNRIGYNAFLLALSCVLVSLLVQAWMRATPTNCAIFSFSAMAAGQFLVFLFRILIRGYDNPWLYLLLYSLPMALITAVWAIPLFFLARWIFRYFDRLAPG